MNHRRAALRIGPRAVLWCLDCDWRAELEGRDNNETSRLVRGAWVNHWQRSVAEKKRQAALQ